MAGVAGLCAVVPTGSVIALVVGNAVMPVVPLICTESAPPFTANRIVLAVVVPNNKSPVVAVKYTVLGDPKLFVPGVPVQPELFIPKSP